MSKPGSLGSGTPVDSVRFRSILNDGTQQFLPDGFYWLLCLKALSERAGTLGHTLALSGTGGELISAQ
jgi:hypothetical protein